MVQVPLSGCNTIPRSLRRCHLPNLWSLRCAEAPGTLSAFEPDYLRVNRCWQILLPHLASAATDFAASCLGVWLLRLGWMAGGRSPPQTRHPLPGSREGVWLTAEGGSRQLRNDTAVTTQSS